jgi:hypothetical protein
MKFTLKEFEKEFVKIKLSSVNLEAKERKLNEFLDSVKNLEISESVIQ